jgi:hypothetical protein
MQAANDNVDPNAPLRLAVAAEHAFPFGGMTEKGLRCEAKRGRLVIWRIANKDFTTLAAIEEMRSKCRLQDNQPASGSVQQEENAQQSGSLSTTDASIALAAARASTSALRERLKPTSRRSA